MPAIGVKCDSILPEYNGEELPFDKCLACARVGYGVDDGHGMRWCHTPYATVKSMSMNQEERKDAGLSVTMLLNECPRQVILQQEHDFYESPKSYWARFRGTISHLMMEEYDDGGEGIIQEVRFSKSITVLGEELTITGKMDHVDTKNKLILDYKSVGSINTKPVNQGEGKPEHVLQLNFYRWLLMGGTRMDTNEEVFHDIERAALVYFDMKGVRKVRADIMDMDDVEQEIMKRLEPFVLHKRNNELPDIAKLPNGNRHFICNFCPVRDICDQIDS